MSGYYQMTRGWQESEFFAGAEYSERDAWIWLIEAAAWQPKKVRVKGVLLALDRGQMTFSVRFLADKWGWSKSRVDRFLKRLAAENMISAQSKNGTEVGRDAGHVQNVLTICNYERYQSPTKQSRDSDDEAVGTDVGQQRDKEEEGNKGIRKEESPDGLSPPAKPAEAYPLSFERIWKVYPRREGKRNALKAWERAGKRCGGGLPARDKLQAAVEAYAANPPDNPQYIPLLATWLNGGRYDDPIEETRNGKSNTTPGLQPRNGSVERAPSARTSAALELAAEFGTRAPAYQPGNR